MKRNLPGNVSTIARVTLALVVLLPGAAVAQDRWSVTVTPTINPLPIGLCGQVHLSVTDPATREVPRRPSDAYRVTMADFDMSVAGAGAAGRWIDASHYEVCACQGATVGATATVTASYPARSVAPAARVAGVSITREAPFTIGALKGTGTPLACTSPATASASSSATASPVAGVKDPSIRPVDPVAGIRDPSVRPVDPVSGVRDPSVRPFDPVPDGTARGGSPSSGGTPIGTPPPQAPRSGGVAAPSTGGGIGVGTPLSAGASAQGRVGLINPSGLTAVQTGTGKVTLSWQPVAGALAYGVTGPGVAPIQGFPFGGTADTTIALTGVPVGSQQWSVGSIYPGQVNSTPPGPPAYTPIASFTKVTLNVIVPIRINPSGLTAVQTGPREVTLSWQPVAGVIGYGVLGPGVAPSAPLPFGGTVETTMIVSGVPAGSQQWSVGSFYTPEEPPLFGFVAPASTPVADFTKVSLNVVVPPKVNPSGLTAVQTGRGEVKLSWQPVAGVIGYGVIGPGVTPLSPYPFTPVAGVTTITLPDVPVGNQQWSVGSLYPPEETVFIYTPPATTSVNDFTKVSLKVVLENPSGLTAVQTGPSEVKLSWQPVAGVVGYGITGPGTMPQAPFPYSVVQATSTTITLSNIPFGNQQWSVGSLFPPKGQANIFNQLELPPIEDFTKVTLNVKPMARSR